MRVQSVRVVSAALTVAICIFLAILSPAPRVLAQTCTEYSGTDPDADGIRSLHFGSQYLTYANYVDGDFFDYTIVHDGNASNDVTIYYFDTVGVWGGQLLADTNAFTYAIPVHTDALIVFSDLPFYASVCTPTPPTSTPTNTPVPPTDTPTPTPTEVIVVTMTPSPTPSPTPVDVGAQLVTISAINYNMLLWSIFIGTISAGLVLLAFIRLRL